MEPRKMNHQLAVSQIVVGVLLVILELAGVGTQIYCMDYINLSGAGMFYALFSILTGYFGLLAMRKPNDIGQYEKPNKHAGVYLHTFFALSVISIILAVGLLFFGCAVTQLLPVTYERLNVMALKRCDAQIYQSTLVIRGISMVLYGLQFLFFIIATTYSCLHYCCSRNHGRFMVINYGLQFRTNFYGSRCTAADINADNHFTVVGKAKKDLISNFELGWKTEDLPPSYATVTRGKTNGDV